eukprot:TRINITY_DN15976_c0_g1_i2.p1 TRINITY_DN15976_c0_g1~~TRINITY_DN15976_c0_g1_i2.p1  ORF type:complete len:429 (-),score=75.99 TRINITY_DN15976_c0_g1_i2:82-1368(-)
MDDLAQRLGAADLNDHGSPHSLSQVVTDRASWAEIVSGHDSERGEKRAQGWISGDLKEGLNKSHEGQLQRKERHEGRTKSDEGQMQRKGHHDFPAKIANDPEVWEMVHHRNRRSGKKYHQVPLDQLESYRRPPAEQVYADETVHNVELEPTEDELHDLSKACNKLWDVDFSCLLPGRDYEIDCGEGKRSREGGDMAENTLFSWVNEDVFKRPTYARFCSLLDNYNPLQASQEVITTEEKREEVAFIEEISRTAPIKYLYRYLVAKGIVPEHYGDFKRMLKSLWFDFFNRHGARNSSCAFEHVFVGEVKTRDIQEVSGLHNWIQFYLEEANQRIDYKGYIFPRRRRCVPDSESRLLTIQFTWNGVFKPTCSTFIGVSPEFEIALYTLCFYAGAEDNHIELGPYDVNIKCYKLEHSGGTLIGSIFPIAEN